MLLLNSLKTVQLNFFSVLFERMQDGGIVSMTLLLICFLITVFFIVKGAISLKDKSTQLDRTIVLINSIGLFALVLGIFSPLLQLIETLDSMEALGGLEAHQIAGGFKQTILPTLFGSLIFLISRASTITLNWLKPINSSS